MKLIYHNIKGTEEYSPFDRELVELSRNQDLLLVSPYIGLSYLKRLINLSKSWKLISDFQEWIISHPNKKQRLEICDFIVKYSENIRHVPDIHAKVLITDNCGFLGSANFTENGIQKRTEMSVSFSEKEKVEELRNWFQTVWINSEDFSKKEITEFINKNENINPKPKIKNFKLTQKNKKRKSGLVPIETDFKTDKDYEQELIKAIRKTKQTKEWINRYFDLVKEIFEKFNIGEDSPKITMSVTSGLKMPISIGQRYVIRPKDSGNTIGLILPLEFREIIADYPDATITEGYFYTNKIQQALWVQFDSDIIFSKDQVLFENWKKAIKYEIERTEISGFRKSHNPFYYRAVMDLKYREMILNK